MSYLPSHWDHSNWVKTQPQRQRFYAQLESFIWLLNLLQAGYCSCGRRRSTLSLVLDPRTTGVWFSKFLIPDWSPKEGHTFSEISTDICGDQHNGLYSSREQKRGEEYCPALCMGMLPCWRCWQVCWIPACCCCCNLIQQRIEPGAQVLHGHYGWGRVKQHKSKVLALENASLLEVLQLSH